MSVFEAQLELAIDTFSELIFEHKRINFGVDIDDTPFNLLELGIHLIVESARHFFVYAEDVFLMLVQYIIQSSQL